MRKAVEALWVIRPKSLKGEKIDGPRSQTGKGKREEKKKLG
jgi:hypothetical protein